MKTFRVLVTACRVVLVKADNPDDAEDFVMRECSGGDWNLDSVRAQQLKTAHEIARCKAHGAVDVKDW